MSWLYSTGLDSVFLVLRILLLFGLGYGLTYFAQLILKKYFLILSETTSHHLDDLIKPGLNSLGWPIYFVVGYNFVVFFEKLPVSIEKIGYIASVILVSFYLAFGVQNLIVYFILKLFQKDSSLESRSLSQVFSLIIKGAVWVLATVLLLQNLGVNINALVGTLGIGGIAVAFALQNILSDIFASFSIYLDRPFIIGDFIQVGKDSGTVEKVGLRSTRLVTSRGEEMIFSNKELLNARIQNFNNFSRRRVEFHLPVHFNTPASKLQNIPIEVEKIINSFKLASFEYCFWKEFGVYQLDFEIVYFLNSSNSKTYLSTQQQINLKIKYYFEQERIELAYLDYELNKQLPVN